MENLNIRFATPSDTNAIFDLIKALAEYEKLTHLVTGNTEKLAEHLFGESPCIEAIVAEYDHKVVGFSLFFTNYSTFLTQPGLYIEDIFVLPNYRRQGIGKALLNYVIKLANEREAGRIEWSVLDWNEPAIAFYEKMGATVLKEWRICRITNDSVTSNSVTSDQ